MEDLESKTTSEDLGRIKIRPISFLTGILFGGFTDVPEIASRFSDNPLKIVGISLVAFGTIGVMLSSIIYADNKIKETKEYSFCNAKLCFKNYVVGVTMGYTIRYTISKLFN